MIGIGLVSKPADAYAISMARVDVVDEREVAPVRPMPCAGHRQQGIARAVGVLRAADALGLVRDGRIAVVLFDAPVARGRALARRRVRERARVANERGFDRRGGADLARAAGLVTGR